MNFVKLSVLCGMLMMGNPLQAQEEITNAFDDLKRQGVYNEKLSEMRQVASAQDLNSLLAEHPEAGYFCFTEDREHDIRMNDAIPKRWVERAINLRKLFSDSCAPGEFFTWQIGLYTPYQDLSGVTLDFSDWKNEKGEVIPASAFRCFNLEGRSSYGKIFKQQIDVAKGNVKALWIGMEIPETAQGNYQGTVKVMVDNAQPIQVKGCLHVEGEALKNHGDDEGWRKTRLRWLDSSIGETDEPTAPYLPLKLRKREITWLGGKMKLGKNGLPINISSFYDQSNQLSKSVTDVLKDELRFIIETKDGEEQLKVSSFHIDEKNTAAINWTSVSENERFRLECKGDFCYDGLGQYDLSLTASQPVEVKDIRLEIPYSAYAAKYMMGLGHKGGLRPDTLIQWNWDVDRHQDKIWMGNVNAGLNFCFKDENYVRPLVNIYYSMGKLNMPVSWGNQGKGGIEVLPEKKDVVLMKAYSGARTMEKQETLHFKFNMMVTPVKPLNLNKLATKHIYHSNSDVSASYIPNAKQAGAHQITVHHKKDIYPFINYPYYDESLPDFKKFVTKAHDEGLAVSVYYTTRELTVKIPEFWALRSLGSEILHDGAGKDVRTCIHPNGPHSWLVENLKDHFIPAWHNAFNEGKYAGDLDLSVITTPDSRWNNYYLEGLDWMVKYMGVDGIYIDDSALDHKTLQRARRILDADGKKRIVDIHSWNHMNNMGGYANSIHLYLELLPYIDRTWIGEEFSTQTPADFWLVEMSGIPFGLMGETLQTNNLYRGMCMGMLPRYPWSGNPVSMWRLWDRFGMKDAQIRGFWDERCPVTTDNKEVYATVYLNGDETMLVLANWSNTNQKAKLSIDTSLLGFKPSTIVMPFIEGKQKERTMNAMPEFDLKGESGKILILKK